MPFALTRAVSETIDHGERTFVPRAPLQLDRARRQHAAFVERLGRLGCTVLQLPALDEHPDATFVEDAAVLFGTIAVVTRPGAASRRGELTSVAQALSPYREVRLLTEPSTLDGGDVLRVGNTFYVGESTRTNRAGRKQLGELIEPHGLRTRRVGLGDCLHLKSAASCVADGTVLVNTDWVDAGRFRDCRVLEVDPAEPRAANTLRVGEAVVIDAAHPRTAGRLADHGLRVETVDLSELAKAEAGPSCLALTAG